MKGITLNVYHTVFRVRLGEMQRQTHIVKIQGDSIEERPLTPEEHRTLLNRGRPSYP